MNLPHEKLFKHGDGLRLLRCFGQTDKGVQQVRFHLLRRRAPERKRQPPRGRDPGCQSRDEAGVQRQGQGQIRLFGAGLHDTACNWHVHPADEAALFPVMVFLAPNPDELRPLRDYNDHRFKEMGLGVRIAHLTVEQQTPDRRGLRLRTGRRAAQNRVFEDGPAVVHIHPRLCHIAPPSPQRFLLTPS